MTVHWLEMYLLTNAAGLVCQMPSQALQRLLTARTVILDIDDDARTVF